MSQTSYLKLIDGSRLTNYMGLQMVDGTKYSFGKNYLYLDIPLHQVLVDGQPVGTDIKRNQHVFVSSAASVNVRGSNFIEVEPTRELAEMGQVQGIYRIHPDSGKQQLGFWFTARKDVDLSKLGHVLRIYMVV